VRLFVAGQAQMILSDAHSATLQAGGWEAAASEHFSALGECR
jgi:hypothetical protein